MTGRSTPAQGGVTDDPIRIGTMLYTLVEPHRGHEVAYNRWYERDHFYAGCQIGAYNFAGARFVATAPLKALRYPRRGAGRRWWPTPRSAATSASTTCSTATTTSGTGGRSTRSTRSTPPGGCSTSATTSTPGCTASSGSTGATRTGCRPSSPWTTGSPGWCRCSSKPAEGVDARAGRRPGTATSTCPRCCPGRPVATVLAFSPLPLLADAPGDVPRGESVDRAGAAAVVPRRRSPAGSWDAVFADQAEAVAGVRPRPGAVGLARSSAPCPGTDTYTDQLWSAPA